MVVGGAEAAAAAGTVACAEEMDVRCGCGRADGNLVILGENRGG